MEATWLLPKANEWLIHVFAQLLIDELKILFLTIVVIILACYALLATTNKLGRVCKTVLDVT